MQLYMHGGHGRYIHNERHCTLVHDQKGLEYVPKLNVTWKQLVYSTLLYEK